MQLIWVRREIAVPDEAVWALLTDVDRWPDWGPTVRSATLDGESFEQGATGRVTTVGGLTAPFEITRFEPGVRWAWKVAGVGATDHVVEPLDDGRCRLGFGVPWPVAPYALVCRRALHHIEQVVTAVGAT